MAPKQAVEIEREIQVVQTPNLVAGVAYHRGDLWVGAGEALCVVDPEDGALKETFPIAADAGTAFDGTTLYQISEDRILKIEPETRKVIGAIPAPGGGRDSGLAWAEGALWVGQYRDRKILKIDPETGEILRTLESTQFVTGVTWFDEELWHGAVEEDERSELRRIAPDTGEVLEQLTMPDGVFVSGLDTDGERFYCGGGSSGRIRIVRRPERTSTIEPG